MVNDSNLVINNTTYDETTTPKQTIVGILLGLGYLSFFIYIPYLLLLILLGSPTTEIGDIQISTLAQGLTALMCIGFMYLSARKPFNNAFKNLSFKMVLKGFLWMFVVLIAGIVVNALTNLIFGEIETNANQASVENLLFVNPILGLLTTVVIAPLIEELIFRFYIFKPLAKKNFWLGLIVSAFSFGLIHMGASFANFIQDQDVSVLLNDLRSLIDYVVAGGLFCLICYKTKSIWGSIFAHSFQNLVASVMVFLSGTPIKTTEFTTNNNSINISFDFDEDTSIYEIYCVNRENEDEKVNATKLDEDSYVFENLVENKYYDIYVKYNYKAYDVDMQLVDYQGEYTTYAFTR